MTTGHVEASDRRASDRPVPVVLAANRPQARPYRGGAGIERFRRIAPNPEPETAWMPEDFVASTTEVFAGGGVGLTTLADGTTLRDAVAAAPLDYLGEAHAGAYGVDSMLLVKLLDTRERLFVHYHPSTAFAREVLAHASGKTEAWIIVATEGPAYARLGFSREVSEDEVLRWFETQDVDGMLSAMNHVSLAPGDTLFVPAGMPHSIGPGITLVELQQPTDLSIILERAGFPIDEPAALLGLDARTAFSDLDRSAVPRERILRLSSSRAARKSGDGWVTPLFPAEADAVFRADRIESHGSATLDAGYSVLVILDGHGELRWAEGGIPVTAGQTVLVLFGVGETVLSGNVTVVRCRPPVAAPSVG